MQEKQEIVAQVKYHKNTKKVAELQTETAKISPARFKQITQNR